MQHLLLDTHILLWAATDPNKLSKKAIKYIEQANLLYVSSVSLWEIAIKSSINKIDINLDDLITYLNEAGIKELAVSWEHSRQVKILPQHHRDPFDRMLIAQAMTEPMFLITHDNQFRQYDSTLIKVV